MKIPKISWMRGSGILLLTSLMPGTVFAQQATPEEIMERASASGLCGDRVPVEAWYEGGVPRVRCGEATAFLPVVGGLGLGGGLAAAGAGLALMAGGRGGGGDATPSTE
jgi:hypothetical protein